MSGSPPANTRSRSPSSFRRGPPSPPFRSAQRSTPSASRPSNDVDCPTVALVLAPAMRRGTGINVTPLLEEAKHEPIAINLHGDDPGGRLSVYTDGVFEAIGTRDAIPVARSLGGFTRS